MTGSSWIHSTRFGSPCPIWDTGRCEPGEIPVYQLINNVWHDRPDLNARYTTSSSIRAEMIARGYRPEGYGPDGVIWCGAP